MADAARFQIMGESLAKLEKSLEAEIKRRAESDKQIQTHFEAEVKSLQERTAIQLADLQAAFKTSIDGMSRTLQDLHTIIKCVVTRCCCNVSSFLSRQLESWAMLRRCAAACLTP